jgi:heme iron utilization protein
MSDDRPKPPTADVVRDVRAVLMAATTAALGTLDGRDHGPHVSLVGVAVPPDLEPVMLLSELAQHTRNLKVNARASLLIPAAGMAAGDPLASARVTLTGAIERIDIDAARAAYLGRHPAAAGYVDFADFAFYRLVVERAHFVGGFGRIVALSRADLAGA